MKYKLKNIIVFSSLLLFILLPQISQAAIKPIMDNVQAECKDNGNCSLNDIVLMVKNLSDVIIALIGSIVLLFFIYGGVVMLTSAGNKERVTQGRRIIVNSLIGLAIIFFSYSIILFVSKTLGVVYPTDPFTSK